MEAANVILFELHGALLRMACQKLNRHFDGLSQCSRTMHKEGRIDSAMKKTLINLDITMSFIRHVNVPKAESTRVKLEKLLDSTTTGADERNSPGKRTVNVTEDKDANEAENMIANDYVVQTLAKGKHVKKKVWKAKTCTRSRSPRRDSKIEDGEPNNQSPMDLVMERNVATAIEDPKIQVEERDIMFSRNCETEDAGTADDGKVTKKPRIDELDGMKEEKEEEVVKPEVAEKEVRITEPEVDYIPQPIDKLVQGDIVYLQHDLQPYKFMRAGWGDYKNMVRVATLHERLHERQSGRWVSKKACIPLETNDLLRTMADIQPAFEGRDTVPKDTVCQFMGFDNDGDLIIEFTSESCRRREVMLLEDLRHLTIC